MFKNWSNTTKTLVTLGVLALIALALYELKVFGNTTTFLNLGGRQSRNGGSRQYAVGGSIGGGIGGGGTGVGVGTGTGTTVARPRPVYVNPKLPVTQQYFCAEWSSGGTSGAKKCSKCYKTTDQGQVWVLCCDNDEWKENCADL